VLGREREHLVEALDLEVAVRPADMLEVQTDLPDDHDHLVLRHLAQRGEVRLGLLERVMAYTGPNLLVGVSERDGVAAPIEVHADRDEARHAGGHGLLHHLGRVPELLDVKMRVYEDSAISSSTSSSRLNSGAGAGSLCPGSSVEGCQRSWLSYSPVMMRWSPASSTDGCGAITSSYPSISCRRWEENGRNGVSIVFRLSTQRSAT